MNGPRYDQSAAAAAQIVNLLSGDMPKAELFSKVLFLILHCMYEAEAGLNGIRFLPSDN